MIHSNCLSHALDRWHTEGGYLVLRKSAARTTPHVLWVGDEGLQHYSPGAPLGHPVRALIGYDGVTWDRDMADAPPVPIRGIVLGALILAVGVTAWAVGRLVKQRMAIYNDDGSLRV